jgi:hypothetical protein
MVWAVPSKIVQRTRNHHDQIRKTLAGIPQYIFHDPGTLGTPDGVFHPDADPGKFAVMPFLGWG